ncbi:MAG: enoyl-CoA hydratase/isomerase family protein [Pseudomonadota bacterium]
MTVELIRHERWAEIILNRPERKNAITGPLGEALADALEAVSADDTINAVLFRGQGGAFCSGLDLDAFNADPKPSWMDAWPTIWRRAHRALYQCDKPIIAALERYAINGGAALILASDIVVTGEGAFLQVGEVKLGMAAPYNMAWLALRFSESVSAQLAILGERVYGPELHRLGIATQCVQDDNVLARATDIAKQLGEYPPAAPARIKRTVRGYSGGRNDIDAWFDQAMTLSQGGAKPPPKAGLN